METNDNASSTATQGTSLANPRRVKAGHRTLGAPEDQQGTQTAA